MAAQPCLDKRSRKDLDSSSLDVTPRKPSKKKIRRRSRMPDPWLPTSTSRSSSQSSFIQRQQRALKSRRRLFPQQSSAGNKQLRPWIEDEVKSLVNYLRCRGYDKTWPAIKSAVFWNSAAKFVSECCSSSQRTGSACRNKVMNTLRKKFISPKTAEAHYFPITVTVAEAVPASTDGEISITPVLHTPQLYPDCPPSQQLAFVSSLFKMFCLTHTEISPPDDFLQLAVLAMEHLRSCERSNVLYGLAKAVGTMRSDKSDSLMPAKRMPMGLMEYLVNFFCCTSVHKLDCPDDYRQWLGSMFSLFGTKFVKLYCGPMWRVDPTSQVGPLTIVSSAKVPEQARTNVPGLSERTLQRQIASSGVLTGAGIQTLLLDTATKTNPHTTWWIKGDGCDVVGGLCESVELKWSGDVDLDDGQLQDSYRKYRQRLDFVHQIGLSTSPGISSIEEDLSVVHEQLLTDKEFVTEELATANQQYFEKLHSNAKDAKQLFAAGWKVEELKKLRETNQNLIVSVSSCRDLLANHEIEPVEENMSGTLTKLRKSLFGFIKDLSRLQRQLATHIFVFMISCERRDAKPYSLPVQCLPYHSIGQKQLRRLVCTLIKEMVSRGMKVAGFCTDGEYNSLRNSGYTRALSIFKIRSDIRLKYAKQSKQKMIDMLTPTSASGQLTGKVQNQAVSATLLQEILTWLDQGVEWNDVISRLRPRTVPNGYTFCKWKKGSVDETEVEMLRSILAQLDFTYTIRHYDERGVPFRTHFHVPEVHPDTGEVFMEREDEGHVLKRIAKCTRNGGPDKLQLQRFAEAVHDKEAGLTYTALVGSRKQSVEDAERLFSQSLLKFMEKHGYSYEAHYIGAVLGWRQACDQRGISELERCRYNYQMLNFLLDELLPWHKDIYDLSLLEVNRDIRVCGFTREVVSALVADIETREWRRRELAQQGSIPENPRASTTDDVECFFSIMRDQIGMNFTLKQVQFEWRKICIEFQKRISPTLPFYYFTSAHDRFYEGPRPSFNEPVTNQKKKRLPRGEQVHAASLGSGRATLPVRGTLTVRPKFHKHPVDVPPPSSVPTHLADHSYS